MTPGALVGLDLLTLVLLHRVALPLDAACQRWPVQHIGRRPLQAGDAHLETGAIQRLDPRFAGVSVPQGSARVHRHQTAPHELDGLAPHDPLLSLPSGQVGAEC